MKHLLFLLIPCALIFSACPGDNMIDPEDDFDTKNIDRIEVDYFFDDVTYVFRYYDSTPQEVVPHSELDAEITSIAGISTIVKQTHLTEFGSTVLGKTLNGNMLVEFLNNSKSVNIRITQVRTFDSFIFGRVNQTFVIKMTAIPFYQHYVDDITDLEVDEYFLEKKQVCSPNLLECYFTEDNEIFYQESTTMACEDRAFVKVKVHFKP